MTSWHGNVVHITLGGNHILPCWITLYPKKYAHGFVVLCFVVVMQSVKMNSHEVFIHIHHGCFAGTWAVVRLPQCQWSKPDGYGKISQCITTTKHSKAKTVRIFLGIYCISSVTSTYQHTRTNTQAQWCEIWCFLSFQHINFWRHSRHITKLGYLEMHAE